MSKLSIQQDLESLAIRLDGMREGATAERLRELGNAVLNGANAEGWSAVDIYQVIDSDAVAARYRERAILTKWVEILEWLRNALIFTPLLVTWYSISQAVNKYNELINLLKNVKDPAIAAQASLPFLYLWQQQFQVPGVQIEPLPTWFTLSSLATADFILLAFVLFLTIVVFWGYSFSNTARDRHARELRDEIKDLLGQATLLLRNKGAQSDNFAVVARQMMAQMEAERKRLDELAQKREKEFGDLAAFTQGVASVSQQMTTAANAIQQTLGSLNHSIHALVGPAGEIADQQRQLLGAAGNAVQQLQNVAQTVTGQMQGVSQTLTDLVTKQDTWGQTFTQAQDRLESLTVKIGQTTGDIGKFSRAQEDFLNHLNADRQFQQQIAQHLSSATIGLRDFIVQLKDTETNLRGMAAEMTRLNQIYAVLPDKLKNELSGSMKSYADAGIALNYASQQLAMTLYQMQQQGLVHRP